MPVVYRKTNSVEHKKEDRTVTMNVSKGGCFIYSVDDLQSDTRLMMMFKELEEQTPILGEVRWRALWGEAMQIPGIGVKFKNLSEGQLAKICEDIGT